MGKRGNAALSRPATAALHGPPASHRVCVARIGAAHGTSGEVRLWPFTADPQAVGGYGALETADGTRQLEIEALRPAKQFLVARFKHVTNRSAAERLCNIDLYVPRARLPAPDDGEFYHADLIGLACLDVAGDALGTVVAVHNFGAGDLLEIAPPTGDGVLLQCALHRRRGADGRDRGRAARGRSTPGLARYLGFAGSLLARGGPLAHDDETTPLVGHSGVRAQHANPESRIYGEAPWIPGSRFQRAPECR